MLLGIYGPHAVGKTTYLQSLKGRDIKIVCGDVLEMNYENHPQFAESKYYRTIPGKVELLTYAIKDVRHLWVVEGMRFWGGMFAKIRGAVRLMSGGLFVIVVITTPEIMDSALRKRAVQNNKVFRDDYWDKSKLEYEASRRALNVCNKNLEVDEWCELHYPVEGEFHRWTDTATRLIDEFLDNREWWYERQPLRLEGVRGYE